MPKVTVEEARAYFAHPSQHEHGLTEKDLPDWADYRARDGVCLAFHRAPLPGVWFCHIGARREAWGSTEGPVVALLSEFFREVRPARIVAWVSGRKRHALALAARTGWKVDGQMNIDGETVHMIGWAE